jgi:uncharacterized membrane protein YbhN (UPF0104 family)
VLLVVALVACLIASRARSIDWSEVVATLRGYDGWRLALAAGLAACSYTLYGCFDLLGRAYALHKLASRRVLAIGMVVYALNLNFGAWLGSVGARLRLYSRNGLRKGAIAGIMGMAMLTNWLGYAALAGVLLAAGAMPLETRWAEAGEAAIGWMLIVGVCGYLAACTWSRKRTWRLRGFHVHLPNARFALLQLLAAGANWALMGSIVWLLMPGSPAYATVLAVLLASSMASVVTHVPGGLGVIEAVFVAALGDSLGEAQVLAALVAYRAVYYLLPLPFAGLGYGWLESRPPTPPARPAPPDPRASAA